MLENYALTSRSNLKEVLGITDGESDSLLDNIINRSTDIIESYCNGRRFKSTAYVNQEYDGSGSKYINLRHYPITVLTSYERNTGSVGDADWDSLQSDFVKYVDDGQGPGQVYYEFGFIQGCRNYRFSYTAGYVTIPYDLEQACIELSVWIYNDRKNKGMKSESLGEYSYTKIDFTGNPIENLGIDLVLEKYRTPVI